MMPDPQRGASFFRCALQVNPHGYAQKYRGAVQRLSPAEYEDALISHAVANAIDVIGVTDHNHVGSVESIASRARTHGITVFPGFEVASREGVHFLCIFEPGTPARTLERYLGQLNITDTTPNTRLSNAACSELPASIEKVGGIAIAAHVTSDKGLLTTLTGTACVQAWQRRELVAIQIPGAIDDLPLKFRRILRNQDREYSREMPCAPDLAVAVVNCKDIAAPEDLADPAASCWIKMTSPSVMALKQAFLDPVSRIRLASDQEAAERPHLVKISFQGGYLDGIDVQFNDNLNVLIGGKGTGKSTLIESIRYVLGHTPVGANARTYHNAVVQEVLRPGTRIALTVHSPRPSPRTYTIERVVSERPRVKDASGEIVRLQPHDVFGEIEIFGQHEINELTRDPSKLDLLIERFAPSLEDLRTQIAHQRSELASNRKLVETELVEIDKLKTRLAKLPAMTEEARRYGEAGVEAVLANKASLVKEEHVLSTAQEHLEEAAEYFDEQAWTPIDETFLSEDELDDLPGEPVLRELRQTITKANRGVKQHLRAIARVITDAEVELSSIREKWDDNRAGVANAEYTQLLRKLGKQSIEAESYVKLQHDIERLKPLSARLVAREKTLSNLRTAREKAVAKLEQLVQKEYRALDTAAKRVSKRLKRQVKVEISYGADRSAIVDVLKEHVNGRTSETESAISSFDQLSVSELVTKCRAGSAVIREWLDIPENQAIRVVVAGEPLFMRLEESAQRHRTKVFLNVASEGETPDWKQIANLSAGQKATAALLLLLLESTAPLIIDQPEDDLDNRFIAEGIVPRMREAKRQRQFLFATHNANIPVLGDSELILAFQARSDDDLGSNRLPPECRGSIDVLAVQNLLEEILEGGRAAFLTRRRKYGF